MKKIISAFWHFLNVVIHLARSMKILLKIKLSILISRLIFRLSTMCVSAWIHTMTDFSWSVAEKLSRKIAILINSFAFSISYMRIDEMSLMIILKLKVRRNSLLTSDIMHSVFIQIKDLISDWFMKMTAVAYFHYQNE